MSRRLAAEAGLEAPPDAAEYFGLPRDRTVIMGSLIEV